MPRLHAQKTRQSSLDFLSRFVGFPKLGNQRLNSATLGIEETPLVAARARPGSGRGRRISLSTERRSHRSEQQAELTDESLEPFLIDSRRRRRHQYGWDDLVDDDGRIHRRARAFVRGLLQVRRDVVRELVVL